MKKICLKLFLTIAFLISTTLFAKPPKLTVVIVIDQFAYHYIEKLSPHFKYAFKILEKNGINYSRAYHPHGTPATATGHATLSTGATASCHGVVLNGWQDTEDDSVDFGDDDSPGAYVFSPNGLYDYGLSAKHLMIDNLSDQLMLNAQAPKYAHKAFALSLKSRAAIGLAGKLGKAIWFDPHAKQFTSSKAYFEKPPEWLTKFNKKHNISKIEKIEWKLFHTKDNDAYKFENIHNYKYASDETPLAGQVLMVKNDAQADPKNDFDDTIFAKTPLANKTLLDLGANCISKNLPQSKNGQMLLWISLSSLDMIGHVYGPSSLEIIDMIYHLDKQIYDFMEFAQDFVGRKNVLFVLTADHGVAPIIDILKDKNEHLAFKLSDKEITAEMNELIEKKYGITKIIKSFKTSQFYLNKEIAKGLPKEQKKAILQDLKVLLLSKAGIKNAWTAEELDKKTFHKDQLENFFKNQLYPARSGDLICMTAPYCNISKYDHGTNHRTPYECDTHVPLFLYQASTHKKKTFNSTVYVTQLAGTLAKIMEISLPSGANKKLLPGIMD